ncbi:KR domain-containing protein [Nocardia xishanensis]
MLCARLRAAGWTVHTESAEIGDRLDAVLWVMPTAQAGAGVALEQLALANEMAGQTITKLEQGAEQGRTSFLAITRIDGARGMRQPALADAVAAGVSGLVKTIAREAPTLFTRTVDLHPLLRAETVCALIDVELHDGASDPAEVGYDSDARRSTLSASAPMEWETAGGVVPSAADTVLVTGGARGITANCVRALADRCEARFVLLGRTPVDPEPDWALGIGDAELRPAYLAEVRGRADRPGPVQVGAVVKAVIASREVRQTLESIDRATYLVADIADRAELRRVLAPHRTRITALVHGAGTLSDRFLRDKTAEEIRLVLDTKVAGLLHLFELLDLDRLRQLVLFSSVSGWYGNSGQADYACANEALNRMAVWFGRARSDCVAAAVNWGAWEGGMVGPALARLIRSRGAELITPEAGAQLFADLFARRPAAPAVELIGPLEHPDFARGSTLRQAH